MKCSIDIYLIIFILIFFIFKNNKLEKNKKEQFNKINNNVKETFANNPNLKETYKSGKYLQGFKYYKTNQTNNYCQDTLIGSLPSNDNAEVLEFKKFNIINSQHYDEIHSGVNKTIVHKDTISGKNKCKRQHAIYLDERFPEKPYASLNPTQYIGSTKDKPAGYSLNYQKNVPEKNKMKDYIVVPIPSVNKTGDDYDLTAEPTYVLLRYKNKPINPNYGARNVGTNKTGDMNHVGYCNNYISCFNNMQDYSNPKCFDVDFRYDAEKSEFKYFQNGTPVLE